MSIFAEAAFASDLVTLEVLEDHIALVTLNRPLARNAINEEMAVALEAIVSRTEADQDVWVIVLTGTGSDVFCAGADLKEVAAGRAAGLFTRNGFAGFVDAERRKPWIAAVNGKALAGGCEIALACDLVIAAQNASFALPEVSRGVLAAAGGLFRLPRALPRNIAIEMALTGDSIDATRGVELGLVNRMVPHPVLVEEALKLAARITRNAPIAVRESLHVMRQVPDLDTDALRELTRRCRDRVADSEDYQEGPRAFVEKRPPRWTGC
ncbi:enoyl-CoA hydratase [Pseudomonas sp. SJZ103]|uniref:enoyl-CoA hydratase-related protein n=1 Tax=unclassified Pseudomonas TaxID=196821 RepID=UPI0011A3023A|nr:MULTISPECIES: enoyl-CoA hydratase-related protein [unclassified Pseudomonas]MBB6290531.1 enoyl-CoA hydratase [Pseudomonas sp. SJZ073]MBB6315742.1 enoyl-CoA hydratase [Pseudomonas sp. JAI120]TWC63142.1 enoyl-CoA hydratase [Pseudomonas sp. SJZ103]TWC80169.1 enoyl-CoA hydratase [Pseudomonas sp. SJZ094]